MPIPTPSPTPTETPTPTQNPQPAPFPGPAASEIPGVIEAENYDRGGEGIAYHEHSGLTGSVVYRNQPPETVDIQARSNVSGGFVVTEAAAGEWLAYTISIRKTGMYNLEVRYAAESREETFYIELDGRNITGAIPLIPAENQGTFNSAARKVKLLSGQHILKLVIDSNPVTPFSSRPLKSSAAFDSITIRCAKSGYESADELARIIFGMIYDESISNAFIP